MKRLKAVLSLVVATIMVLSLCPCVSFAAEELAVRGLYAWGGTVVSTDNGYNAYETEHFQILWGDTVYNNITIDSSYLTTVEAILERSWDLHIGKLGMTAPTTSVSSSYDQTTPYKVNVVLMGTGVPEYDYGWAFAGLDKHEYPYLMCGPDALKFDTVVAHEFGHAVHYAQCNNGWVNNNYLGPWWEGIANWFAEQYMYEYADTVSGINKTDLAVNYLRATHLTKMNGRGYYEAWPILQYLTENPDGFDNYGTNFVHTLLAYKPSSTDVMFWEVLDACNGDVSVYDTVGAYASHMATMDFEHKDDYNDKIESYMSIPTLFWQQRYTMLEELGESGEYVVPVEKTPQAMGYNIIPLDFTAGEVSVTLNAMTDVEGAGWRARLVKESSSGTTTYSDLFKEGETMSITASSTDELYLTVAATPTLDSMTRHTITGWTEASHETNMPYEDKLQYPYSVTLTGATPMSRPTPSGTFKTHSNGGGKVATTATVASTAYVGPNAVVMGYAKVSGNAIIDDYAIVAGNATVSGNAYVGDYAVLFDRAEVTDNARVIENACVYVDYKVSGSAVVKGSSLGLYDGSATGEAITYGDWFEDSSYDISGGAFSGYHSISYDSTWTNSKYAPLTIEGNYVRPYANNIRSRYEFEGNLRDTWSYTDLYGVGSPEVTNDYITFTGEEYVQLDPSSMYYDSTKLTLGVRGEGEVFNLGEGDIVLKIADGTASLTAGGTVTSPVTCSEKNFNEIEIEISSGSMSLTVNGETVTGNASVTVLDAVRSGKSYLGKNFTGDVDYLRIFDMSKEYSKQIGGMEDGDYIAEIDTRASSETGTLNSKTEDINSSWYGWTSTNTSGVTVAEGLNVTGAVTATISSPGYKTDKFVIEFTPDGDAAYPDHGIIDTDGEVLFAHRYATDAGAIHVGRGETNSSIRGTNSVSDTTGQARLENFVGERLCSGSFRTDRSALKWEDGQRVRIVAQNSTWTSEMATAYSISENYTDNLGNMTTGDDIYIVSYAIIDHDLVIPVSESVYTGSFTGFGGFKTAGGSSGKRVSYKDLVIYTDCTDLEKVTITYTADGENVKTVSKSYDTSSETGAVFPEVYEYENGVNAIYYAEGGTYSADKTVEMTNLAGGGLTVGTRFEASDGGAYKTTTENLIGNGDFENGLKGWYNAAGSEATTDYFTVNTDGTITAKASTGVSSEGSLYRAWDVEIGKTYVFTYTSDVENQFHVVSQKNDISATNDGTIIGTGKEGTNYFVFTANKEYVQINFRWLASNNTIGNFGLYEVASAEEDRVVTTIKFMAGSTNIGSVTVNGFIGDVIDLTDTELVPEAITYSDSVYTKDESNSASYTANQTGTVTITYTKSDIQSIETVSATVIGDNLPVLPTTLTATTTEGTMEVDVEWDFSTLTEGENTVYGTVSGTTLKAEASVTVLTESFALADSSSTTSGSGNIVYFPLSIPDEFYIEFDFVASNVKNNWIYISNNGALWGSGQIGLGTNNDTTGQFKAQPVSTVIATISNNVNYRMFIRGDASTDTYDFTLYNADTGETLASVTGRSFRKAADSINSINLCTNGGGAYKLSNIKVYYPGYATASFITKDGTLVRSISGDVQSGSFTVSETVGFVIDDEGAGHYYQIPETVVSEDVTVVVSEITDMYAVLEDAYVQGTTVYGINTTDTNSVFIAAVGGNDRAPLSDADNVALADGTHTPSTLGTSRVGLFQFPVLELEDGKAAIAHFYVRSWHGNTFANSNTSIRMAGYAVNDDAWLSGTYTAANAPLLEGQTNAMFTSRSTNTVGYITLDITEAMKAAHNKGLDTITIRINAAWGAAYIAEREAAVAGGTYEGKAAYLTVEDGTYITVSGATKVTKDGSLMSAPENGVTIPESSTVKMYTDIDSAVAFTNGTKVYKITDGVTDAITPEEGGYYPASVGVNMVQGAQVRIGKGVDGDGKVGDGSGLRFVAQINRADSLANVEGAAFGVKITAQDSETQVDIHADKWQSTDVFTTAITNLAPSNYNREFTATPYITVDGQTFEGTPVTRSIYCVAAGILVNGYTAEDNATGEDKTGTEYELTEVLVDVLNAYVNQTGIRLTITSDGTITAREEGSGAYTGELFFDVSRVDNNDGSYTVTVTPSENAEIKSWWKEYVRINNNNSAVVNMITNDTIAEDGTLTFTFTPVVSTTE